MQNPEVEKWVKGSYSSLMSYRRKVLSNVEQHNQIFQIELSLTDYKLGVGGRWCVQFKSEIRIDLA